MTNELSVVWYIESRGAVWEESSESAKRDARSEHYEATGVHELWVLDRGEILARATSGALACSILRPAASV